MNFNAEEYTRDSIVQQLLLTELHARDNSAVEGGCGCIEEKHLTTIIGLCNESATLMSNKEEVDFYLNEVAPICRELRTRILMQDFKGRKKHTCTGAALSECIEAGKTESECKVMLQCP